MDITIRNIQTDLDDKFVVQVDFSQETDDGYVQSALVTVYLRKEEDAAFAEIENASLQAAFDFLKTAFAARSE
jgi:uncharacterized protein YehS (DUF1456 family)